MTTDLMPQIDSKTLEEWNLQWVRVPNGLRQHQAHLTEDVGLYRYLLDGQTMALGTGTDSKGGIAKRLSDMIRPSWSGRDHHAGQLIYAHRNRLTVEVLLTGAGRYAQAIARRLKGPMVNLHQPVWNAPNTAAPSRRDLRLEGMASAPQRSDPRRRSKADTAPLQMIA